MRENWASLIFFLGLATQWRCLVGPKRMLFLGLDYTAVESAMRMDGVQNQKSLLCDLREMEAAALVVLNGGDFKSDGEEA